MEENTFLLNKPIKTIKLNFQIKSIKEVLCYGDVFKVELRELPTVKYLSVKDEIDSSDLQLSLKSCKWSLSSIN